MISLDSLQDLNLSCRKSSDYQFPTSESSRKRLKTGLKRIVKIGGDTDESWKLGMNFKTFVFVTSTCHMCPFPSLTGEIATVRPVPEGDWLCSIFEISRETQLWGVTWLCMEVLPPINPGVNAWTILDIYYHHKPHGLDLLLPALPACQFCWQIQ